MSHGEKVLWRSTIALLFWAILILGIGTVLYSLECKEKEDFHWQTWKQYSKEQKNKGTHSLTSENPEKARLARSLWKGAMEDVSSSHKRKRIFQTLLLSIPLVIIILFHTLRYILFGKLKIRLEDFKEALKK